MFLLGLTQQCLNKILAFSGSMAIFRKERGAFFEGSGKKYPSVELPKWMRELEAAEHQE